MPVIPCQSFLLVINLLDKSTGWGYLLFISQGEKAMTNFNIQTEITAGKSIRLYGEAYGNPVDVTFLIGDEAEYDSYNFSYYGEILSITEKTVTIKPRYGNTNKRLKVRDFIWRNYNFSVEKAIEQRNGGYD